jgi:hypothetical protein
MVRLQTAEHICSDMSHCAAVHIVRATCSDVLSVMVSWPRSMVQVSLSYHAPSASWAGHMQVTFSR